MPCHLICCSKDAGSVHEGGADPLRLSGIPIRDAEIEYRRIMVPVAAGGQTVAMTYEVTVADAAARPTVVVPATTTWQEFPTLWSQLLDEVWACLRASGIERGCRNVMLYHDDVPNVEVGVLLDKPCPLTGRVVASTLPAGAVATTVHYGPYGGLGAAHQAVVDWCTAQGLRRAGPRWEVYGPHRDDPAEVWTEVHWLLQDPRHVVGERGAAPGTGDRDGVAAG
jgi:effector-binding domain-containing protein